MDALFLLFIGVLIIRLLGKLYVLLERRILGSTNEHGKSRDNR